MPAILVVLLLLAGIDPASGYVFLDTSSPAPSESDTGASGGSGAEGAVDSAVGQRGSKTVAPSGKAGGGAVADPAAAKAGKSDSNPIPAVLAPMPASVTPSKPHFRTVLFLSADNMLVYSHLGVLKALEEFDLDLDLVLAESKAVVAGAAWALGYPFSAIEEKLVDRPFSAYLRRYRPNGSHVSRFAPYGPDPIQIEMPFSLQSLQSPDLDWGRASKAEADEYLHLAWLVAKLTHDAPGGPVEDLGKAPRRMAVQVTDLEEERGKVLTQGPLQGILKASLLPGDVVHARRRLWPYATGALVSGHAIMAEALPFTFERIVLVQPGKRLRPPVLDGKPDAWEDSLARRLKPRPYEGSGAGMGAVVRIELNPDAGFDARGREPRAWMDLGYTSTLRSMDVLISVLGKDSAAARGGGPKAPPGKAAALPPPLGLNRFTVNPLASGGRQLLQDLVRKSVEDREDSIGDGPLSDLVLSGYYADLDVEWVPAPGEEHPGLVFEALEKSRLLFQAGANLANSGEDLPDRGPEIFAGLAWSEPFYVPFRADAAFLAGGRRPGFSWSGRFAPIHPVHLELGMGRKDWWMRYPAPPDEVLGLAPRSFRLDASRSELFLNLLPHPGVRTGTAIQWRDMEYPPQVPTTGQLDPSAEDYESVDFQQTLFLGAGETGPAGLFPQSVWLRYRNVNRINILGPVRRSHHSFESRIRASWGDLRFFDQYYWSNPDGGGDLFDFLEAGAVQAFSFQDEFFLSALRGVHFQNVQAEYSPSAGRFGMRLMAGGFRLYGNALLDGLGDDFTRTYWEAQASYATPVGPFRAGLAGVQGEKPIFFVRLGADLDLEPDARER
jgi:hypothetical protein